MSQTVELEDIKLDSETEPTTDGEITEGEDILSRGGGGGGGGEGIALGEGEQEEEAPPEEKSKDPSTYTLVEAAQYGVLERCRELVEGEGMDVTRKDEEGITVLHWAAINNRISVASYFIQKGANINAIGGELKSAPLHWATRQGHLSMVVLLMRYGADPELLDAEGLNCVHVAAMFSFTEIVGYFLSYHIPVHIDSRDGTGRTPLIVAAARAAKGYDPTRLIVSLGADMYAVDNDNCTALHYAAENFNHPALKLLVESGSPLEIKNKDGKTAYDVAMENQNRFAMDTLTMGRQKRNPQGIREYLTRDPWITWWIMLLAPTVFLGLGGYLGVICPNWWTYIISTSIFGWVIKKFLLLYVPAMMETTPLALGLVMGTKFWIVFTSYVFFIPGGTLVHTYWLVVTIVVALYVFYRAHKSDPGQIPKSANTKEAFKTIAVLCERGLFHANTFCSTCLVRRPLRSKHCVACNRCVARFDHHCPWIHNCVGLHNHKIFLLYLVCLLFTLTWCAKASLAYLYHYHPADHGNFLVRMFHYVTVNPWVGFIMVMCYIHLTWVYLLLLAQLFQMICQGMTTNEKRNAYRYALFHKFGGSNPFHRGVLANCVDFFGFTCCQDNQQVDWTRTYDLPRTFSALVAALEDPRPKVKIPMPYSSSWDPSRDSVGRGRGRVEEEGGERSNGGLVGEGPGEEEQTHTQQFSASREYKI